MQRISYQERIQQQDEYLIISQSSSQSIELFQKFNLMRTGMLCDQAMCRLYGQQLSLIKDNAKVDGFRLRCSCCSKSCNLRTNSIFEGTKLPINCFLRIIISFAKGFSISEASSFCQCSKDSIKTCYKYLRKMISFYIQEQYRITQLGKYPPELQTRQDIGIEVDESLITHLNSIKNKVAPQICAIVHSKQHQQPTKKIIINN